MGRNTEEKQRRRRDAMRILNQRDLEKKVRKESCQEGEKGEEIYCVIVLLSAIVLGFLFLSWLGGYAERIAAEKNNRNYYIEQEKQ